MDPRPIPTDDKAGRDVAPRGRRTRPIPAVTFAALLNVSRMAAKSNDPGISEDRLELRSALEELLQQLPNWPIGLRVAPSVIEAANGRLSVCLQLDKPREEGLTERVLDLEALLVLLAHCVAGGRLSLEPHGSGEHYYFRLTLPQFDLPASFRAYVLRLIVGTSTGKLTREHPDYHDLRRACLGGLRADTNDKQAWLGVEQAKSATMEALERLIALHPSSVPDCLTIATARALLDEAYALLNAVPLGQSEAA